MWTLPGEGCHGAETSPVNVAQTDRGSLKFLPAGGGALGGRNVVDQRLVAPGALVEHLLQLLVLLLQLLILLSELLDYAELVLFLLILLKSCAC